jgi:hypothetical protein
MAGGSRYAGVMRYPDTGGLTAAECARREQVRLEAAELIEAWVILAAVKQYLGHARAFPSRGRPVEKPLWHGFTLYPPNPMEHPGG